MNDEEVEATKRVMATVQLVLDIFVKHKVEERIGISALTLLLAITAYTKNREDALEDALGLVSHTYKLLKEMGCPR